MNKEVNGKEVVLEIKQEVIDLLEENEIDMEEIADLEGEFINTQEIEDEDEKKFLRTGEYDFDKYINFYKLNNKYIIPELTGYKLLHLEEFKKVKKEYEHVDILEKVEEFNEILDDGFVVVEPLPIQQNGKYLKYNVFLDESEDDLVGTIYDLSEIKIINLIKSWEK